MDIRYLTEETNLVECKISLLSVLGKDENGVERKRKIGDGRRKVEEVEGISIFKRITHVWKSANRNSSIPHAIFRVIRESWREEVYY